MLCSWDLDQGENVRVQLNDGVTLIPQGLDQTSTCWQTPLDTAAIRSLHFPTYYDHSFDPQAPAAVDNLLTITYPPNRKALIYGARLVIKAVRPVVLVPGFDGKASTYNWGEVETTLNNNGVITERPCDYGWYPAVWSPGSWQVEPHDVSCFERVMRDVPNTGTLDTNSRALRYTVAAVRNRYGVNKVNLVGHSKGGLFSRAYVSAPFYQNDVENLVSISSPQRGAYLQDVAMGLKDFPHCDAGLLDPVCEMGRRAWEEAVYLVSSNELNFKPDPNDLAGLEVTEWFFENSLKVQHRLRPAVAYHSVIATAGLPAQPDTLEVPNHGVMQGRNQPIILWALDVIYGLNYYSDQTSNPGQSDILIQTPSQRIANINSDSWQYERSCAVIRANHDESRQIVEAGRAVVRALGVKNNSLDGVMLNCDDFTTPVNLGAGALQLQAADAQADSTSLIKSSGVMTYGESITVPFVVDGDQLGVLGGWQGAGSLTLTLQTPTGQWITPTTALTDPNVGYFDMRDPAATFGLAEYAITETVKGNWTAQFVAPPAGSTTGPIDWNLLISQRSSLTFTVGVTASTYPLGTPIVVQATAMTSTTPVTGAVVTASLQTTSGITQALSLLDDGAHADGVAGDGIYGAVFTPSQPGTYWLSATLTGTLPSGLAYQRRATTLFRCCRRARISPTPTRMLAST